MLYVCVYIYPLSSRERKTHTYTRCIVIQQFVCLLRGRTTVEGGVATCASAIICGLCEQLVGLGKITAKCDRAVSLALSFCFSLKPTLSLFLAFCLAFPLPL